MATTAQIVFRGLMAFVFEDPHGHLNPKTGPNGKPVYKWDDWTTQNLGKMTVLLIDKEIDASKISDPTKLTKPLRFLRPLHAHKPKAFLRASVNGTPGSQQLPLKDKRITADSGFGAPGVSVGSSFFKFVPNAGQLTGTPTIGAPFCSTNPPELVKAQVVIPRGRLAATRMVRWEGEEGHAMSERVEMINHPSFGHLASEAVIEMELDPADPTLVLTTDSLGGSTSTTLRANPFTLGPDVKDEVQPDTVELTLTNFSPQRAVKVPWSIHYQWFYDLIDPLPSDMGMTVRLAALRSRLQAMVATGPDPVEAQAMLDEFNDDVNLLCGVAGKPNESRGYPFPCVIDFENIRGRGRAFRSPEYRPICPFMFGQE